jgi:hypothetical protein
LPYFPIYRQQSHYHSTLWLMTEAVRTSETSVYPNEITRLYIPEDSRLHNRRLENLKSYNLSTVDLGFTLSVSFHRAPHAHTWSGGWTIGPLAAVWRHSLTPSTWSWTILNKLQQAYYLLMRTACSTHLNHFPYIVLTIFWLMARLAASKLNVGLNDLSSIPSRASIASLLHVHIASEASQWAQWLPAGLTTLLHVFQTSRISGASPPCPYNKGEYRFSKLRRCGSSLAKPGELSVRIRRKLLKSMFGIRSCMYRYLERYFEALEVTSLEELSVELRRYSVVVCVCVPCTTPADVLCNSVS